MMDALSSGFDFAKDLTSYAFNYLSLSRNLPNFSMFSIIEFMAAEISPLL